MLGSQLRHSSQKKSSNSTWLISAHVPLNCSLKLIGLALSGQKRTFWNMASTRNVLALRGDCWYQAGKSPPSCDHPCNQVWPPHCSPQTGLSVCSCLTCYSCLCWRHCRCPTHFSPIKGIEFYLKKSLVVPLVRCILCCIFPAYFMTRKSKTTPTYLQYCLRLKFNPPRTFSRY